MFIRKGLKLIVFLLLFLSVLGSNLYARDSYERHKLDYYAVLGIERAPNNPLKPLFKKLNDIIDQEGGNSEFIKDLKEKYGVSFGGGKKHRYLFHWGFNQDIEKFEPLIEALNKEISEDIKKEGNLDKNQMEKEKKEKVKDALKFIKDKRNEANRELIEKCMQITGLPRNEAAGLLTILWDIHILADYTGKELEGLPHFCEVSIDLREKGINRLFEQDIRQSSEFERMVDQMVEQLDSVYSNGPCGYLNVLCGYSDCENQVNAGNGALAQLLNQSKIIRGILEKNGIFFTPSQ